MHCSYQFREQSCGSAPSNMEPLQIKHSGIVHH